ncbi:MAG TPA: ParB/RepB/Spo0J family partition protein [Gemmatimonadaceae bacterium]|nr:ParB/RepB/Spo0J family partition protein [Gemmatimonadaceae bacterium]
MAEVNWANATSTELAARWEAEGHGLTDALLKQTRATLTTLHVAPKVFQPRDLQEQSWKKEQHIRNLVSAIRQGAALDPIVVFPIAGARIVVDGHCRLLAYQQAGRRGKVPVQYLRGSFADALLFSAEANSKDKLPLTKAEKLEAAWRLVLYDGARGVYTLRDIATKTGVSKSTVDNMKTYLQESPAGSANDPRGGTWADAKGARRDELEYDERWEERLVSDWADRLKDTFGDKPMKMPVTFIEALRRAYPRAWDALLDEVAEGYKDDVQRRAEEMAESDF